MSNYNYIIIGAGPAGLFLAYLLNQYNYSCLLIDKADSMGGCHRVTRVNPQNGSLDTENGLFTEHSPRIYSTSYTNTIMLLNKMGINFYDLFTPYNFSIQNVSGQSLDHFSVKEIGLLTIEFIKLIFNKNHGKNITIGEFCTNFSDDAQDYINRLCRLTDGAGADRYTLNEFLQLINQQSLYKLYQPRYPTDVELFPKIINKLTKTTIMLETEIININYSGNKIINVVTNGNQILKADNYVMAIPPMEIIKLIKNVPNAYGDINTLRKWAIDSNYINDISIAFHWDNDLHLPKIWGFPKEAYGIGFIVLSDYMNFDDPRSKTVISCAITLTDNKSSFNNKTANECSEKELIDEAFRQLKVSYPNLPEPTYSLLNPHMERINNKWQSSDTAYMAIVNDIKLPYRSKTYDNLYNLGTHNGNSDYSFTSFESAVSNSLNLFHTLVPEGKEQYKIQPLYTLIDLIYVIAIIVLIVIIYRSI